MEVILMSGVPGSGKSFKANCIAEKYPEYTKIVSADNYWLRPDDIYDWNPKYLKNAHEWCQKEFYRAIRNYDIEIVIVDNTNITIKERQPYISMCEAISVPWRVQTAETSWMYNAQECFNRNTHNVPLNTIESMLSRWDIM